MYLACPFIRTHVLHTCFKAYTRSYCHPRTTLVLARRTWMFNKKSAMILMKRTLKHTPTPPHINKKNTHTLTTTAHKYTRAQNTLKINTHTHINTCIPSLQQTHTHTHARTNNKHSHTHTPSRI